MSYNRFLELYLREKSGEFSEDDEKELNELRKVNPGCQDIAGMVDQLYEGSLHESKELDEEYLRVRWNSLKEKTIETSAKKANKSKNFQIHVVPIVLVLFMHLGVRLLAE